MVQYTINGFADFSLAYYCVPAGILGATIGRKVSSILKKSTVRRSFYVHCLRLC
ncbi:hypothetical protein [Alkalibaculum bacchi]|uniref:hypothetical protein n=1 Tax=Alkalibaculum bacchi TaxID=645887 RepID=UPI0026EA13F0|nr:hypothetical protein [Alkalibaculum bacchi]